MQPTLHSYVLHATNIAFVWVVGCEFMSRATSIASSHIFQINSKRTYDMQKQQELLLAEARRELDQEKQSRRLFERETDARLTKAQRECVGVGVERCSLVDWVCVRAGTSISCCFYFRRCRRMRRRWQVMTLTVVVVVDGVVVVLAVFVLVVHCRRVTRQLQRW